MDAIRSAIARARFRLLMQGTLHWLGWLLLAAAVVAAAMIVVDRQGWLALAGWAYAIPGALAALAAPVIAWLRRPSDAAIAARLDDRLGLKDRLGTALFATSLQGSPFAHHVVSEAQRAAQHLQTRSAVPVRFGRVWAFVPVAAAMCVALAMMLDPVKPGSAQADQQQAQRNAQQAQNHLIEARSIIKDVTAGQNKPSEAADPDRIDNRLATITQQNLANPDMQRQARAELSRMREQLEEAGRTKQQEYETVRNALSQLESQQYGPADQFTKALRRGDFEQAQNELQQLRDEVRTGEMSESDRRLLADQLRGLSGQLDQTADQSSQKDASSPPQQRAAQRTKDLGKSMQEMADSLDPEPKQQPQQQENNQQQQAKEQPQQKQPQQNQPQKQNASQPPQSSQQNSQQQTAQQQTSQRQESQQKNGQQQGAQQQASQQQGGQQQKSAPSPAQQPRQSPQPQQSQQQAQQGPQSQQTQQSQQAQQSQPGQSQQQQSSQGTARQSQQPGSSQNPSSPSQFNQRAWQTQQQLDEMSDMKRDARKFSQAQEKVREAMQSMEDGRKSPGNQPQPGQRAGSAGGDQPGDSNASARQAGAGDTAGQQPAQPGAQQAGTMAKGGTGAGTAGGGNPLGAQQQPGNYQTHAAPDIQHRRGRVIASWLEEGGEMRAGESTVEFDRAITEAQDQAERAVTDDRVPRQYHGSIKDYFGQLKQSAREAQSAPSDAQ